jgi:hypothetical protein
MLSSQGGGSGAMSTIAIVIFVAIGLVILMRLNEREEGKDYAPSDRGSSLASYIVAMGVLLGIIVLVVRGCQGSF